MALVSKEPNEPDRWKGQDGHSLWSWCDLQSRIATGCYYAARDTHTMDYANDNERPRIGQYRGSYVPLALALLVSLALWFVVGLSV